MWDIYKYSAGGGGGPKDYKKCKAGDTIVLNKFNGINLCSDHIAKLYEEPIKTFQGLNDYSATEPTIHSHFQTKASTVRRLKLVP